MQGNHLPTSPATEAYKQLSHIGNKAAPFLIAKLPELPDAAAWRAADLLGQMNDPSAVPALSKALTHTNGLVRNEAAAALSRLGLTALPYLLSSLSESNTPTAEIARALSQFNTPEVLETLKKLAVNPDPTTAYTAVQALSNIDPEGRAFLKHQLVSEGTPVTLTLLDVLLTNPDPDYTQALINFALLSPEPDFRQAAIRVLKRLKKPSTSCVLMALASDPNPDTRESAKAALTDPVHAPAILHLATSTSPYYADKATPLLVENSQARILVEQEFRNLTDDQFYKRHALARLLQQSGWDEVPQDIRVAVALYTADWNMLAYASPRTRTQISKALAWPDARLREGAARMLGLHGSRDEVAALAHTLETDESIDAALSAKDSLVRLGRIGIPGLRSVQGDAFSLFRAAEGLDHLSYRPGLHSEKALQALLAGNQDQLYRMGPGAIQDLCSVLRKPDTEAFATAQQLARMADRGCPSDQLSGLDESLKMLLEAGDQDNRTDRMLAHSWTPQEQHLLLIPIFSRHQRFQYNALKLYEDSLGLATLCAQHINDRDTDTRRAAERLLLQLDQKAIRVLVPLLSEPLSSEAQYAARILARLEYLPGSPLEEARYRAARGQWAVLLKLGESGTHLLTEALARDDLVRVRSILRVLNHPEPFRERIQELFLIPDEETARLAASLLARDETGTTWLAQQLVEDDLIIAQRAQYGLSSANWTPGPDQQIAWYAASGAIGKLIQQKKAVTAYALNQLTDEKTERQYDAARMLMALRFAPLQ